MRMQSSQANCGSTSVYNAACALGRAITLDECEAACGVTATLGTPTKKLLAGIKNIGLKVYAEIKEARDDVALLLIDRHLDSGRVAIISVDEDSHWVTVIGIGGGRYLVADSAESELVLSLSDQGLLDRWGNPNARRAFYAAVVA